MEKFVLHSPILLLTLTCLTLTQGQYFDVFQGLEQLFQPFQQPPAYIQYDDNDRFTSANRQTNRHENKKKGETQDRHTKKPPLHQYEYVFATTTPKTTRKTTKSHSSHTNSKPTNIRKINGDIVFRDFDTLTFETTTKRVRVLPNNRVRTTTVRPINKATTENVFERGLFDNSYNRPVPETNHRNLNTDIVFRDDDENLGIPTTTKRNSVTYRSRTTTARPVSYNTNQGTANANYERRMYDNIGSNDYNRPVTENSYRNNYRKDTTETHSNIRADYQNNRRTESNNNQHRVTPNNWNPNNRNTNNNNNQNNRYPNNEQNNNDNSDVPKNTRNPNVYGINPEIRSIHNNKNNNVGSITSGFINTGTPNRQNNFGNNNGSPNRENNNFVNNNGSPNRENNNFGNNNGSPNRENNNFGNNNGSPNRDNNNFGNNNGSPNRENNNFGTNNFNRSPDNRVPTNNFENINRGVLNTDYDNESNDKIYNPYPNNPGVKPLPIDVNKPPITNRPVTQRPYDEGFERTTERADVTPEILIGPDENDMSEQQKRRYIDMAERMCDNYKSLNFKEIVALPLLPSPDPVQVNVSSCVPITAPLVIGGKIASINEFPHMALVGWKKRSSNGYGWKCGGSLISNQYVLTAGHCTYQEKDYDVEVGPPQAVQLGSSYLDDSNALIVKVSAVIRHPKYKQRRSYYDIALIKLVQTVKFSEVVRPACLGVPPAAGQKMIATGWGRTEFGEHSTDLRSVSLPVWTIEECREVWGTSLKLPNGPLADNHVCAGVGGRDTCRGDSGGPAQIQDGCIWRIVAVTSYGRSCGAPNTPALYAIAHRAFIAAQVFGEDQDQGYGNQDTQPFDSRREPVSYNRQTDFSNSREPYYSGNSFRRQ